MRISQAHTQGRFAISFELFPPKDAEGEARLFGETVPALLALEPDFMTCTYGAGGSTREKTLQIVSRIKSEHGVEVASHLTCVGGSRAYIADFLDSARQAGIENIVALRGDPPKGDAAHAPPADGFQYAGELVSFIRRRGDFDIAVAGYPEGHPECPERHLDWERCRRKVEAGANMIITQLFYDLDDFFRFDDYMKNKLGVSVPIVPGILPILSGPQIERFCGLCGAKLPRAIREKLASFGEDRAASRVYGVELATRMCEDLMRYGVPGFHFYTLNRVDSTREVLRNLRLAVRSG
ncbi:MAG TPA: methylenetetrahydrofolate reductase [NAD(P)H] [Phycisphaerae bacterium]|nr:methylenetetrahydrofolate reductase [NAD(P)H] [Phycisphaerae bacterium]